MIAGITASTRRGGPEIEWPYAPILLSLANQVPPEGEVWEIDKYNTTYVGRVGFTKIIFLDEYWDVLGDSIFSESYAEISLMPGTRYVEVFEEFTEDSNNVISFRGYRGATIQSVVNWGAYPYAGMSFHNCEHLEMVPDFIPETFTTLDDMFSSCTQFNSPNVEFWDTSNIQSMFGVFQKASSFNANIGSWDTSNVVYQDEWGNSGMQSMFERAGNFNQDLSGWCVSQFTEEPPRFSLQATSWTLPKPVWGTCPQQAPSGDFALIVGDAGESGVGYASEINLTSRPPTGTLLKSRVGIAGEFVTRWETFLNKEGSLSIWAQISRDRPYAETKDALVTFHLPDGDVVREFTLNLLSMNYIRFSSNETIPDWVVGQTAHFSIEIL